jgi:hypothetical protein
MKGTLFALVGTLFLLFPLCGAASSCEQPVTNNYYQNSNNTTNNNYYGSSSITGQPSITPNFINKMLCTYGNLQTCGTEQTLYNGGIQHSIDPVFALAFFWHESNFGTKGEAQYSKSLGNLRCIDNEASCTDGYAWFNSWEDGYTAWYDLIANLYIKQWRLCTIDVIIPKYAPAADNNNEQAYISNLKSNISLWRAGNTTFA